MKESFIRSLSGIVYIVLLIAATWYSSVSFHLLFAVFMCIAAYEFSKLYRLPIWNVVPLVLATLGTGIWLNVFPQYAVLLLAVLPFSVYLLFHLFQNQPTPPNKQSVRTLHLLGYVLLPFLIISQIPFRSVGYEPKIIIGIFILIWTNDTFAYICGKWLGKHKLLERISPKKTIEGFVGGILFSLIASFVLSHYFSFFPMWLWLLTALITSCMGTIGDLIESKYKRQAQVKDSGSIMPGHGGILDRLDSVLYAVPFLFLIYQIL